MDWKTFLKKNKLEEGQLVKVTDGKQEQIGNIIPSSGNDKEILRLKLNSGYNIGIKISDKLKVEKLEGSKKVSKGKKTIVKQKPGLPKIAILHTGGTIASRVDYRTGAVYSSFDPDDLLAMFPELLDIANFSSKLISNMWSDDLRFTHFEAIGKAVEKAYKAGAEGIILGMGTDNMAVASAAMAFVLEKCPIPVIFVGAQRSSDRGSSDAAMNLICAAEFIAKTDFAGVALCMHYDSSDDKCVILPACKTRKLHSSRRDAFRAVNDTPIALVDYKSKKIEFLKKDYERKSKEKMVVKPKFEDKTGLLKIHINMFPEQFEFYTKNKYKGLVIEGTGLGHTPGHNPDGKLKLHEKFFPAIKKLVDSGCVVVMTTQTIFGRVHMHVYDKATDLVAQGVIPGEDMLPNTAFVKLAWLLGNYKTEQVKELIGKNLRGEISEATPYEEEFLE
ncbi:MAG: Glu-tRNA(Gln) amidotransferase subunit GatD [Candidatus Diapherotrites archaeon]